jgi:hypothetical protein
VSSVEEIDKAVYRARNPLTRGVNVVALSLKRAGLRRRWTRRLFKNIPVTQRMRLQLRWRQAQASGNFSSRWKGHERIHRLYRIAPTRAFLRPILNAGRSWLTASPNFS